jgi:predicted nuclease with RNAse H fold
MIRACQNTYIRTAMGKRAVVSDFGGPRRFLGVDLASAPERTGVASLTLHGEGRERRGRASLVESDFFASDDALVELVTVDDVVGVDAPLGWPDDFVEALRAHRAFAPWPFDSERDERRRDSLRLRRTDLFVRNLNLGSTPLSVSSDLIGVVAMRAASLQSAWGRGGEPSERRDGSGRFVETYPAAALRQWGLLPARGVRYKGGARESREGEAAMRSAMLDEIETSSASWLDVDEALHGAARRSDHVFDALICALVAAAAKAQLTHVPPSKEREAARREGWIHVPRGELGDLAQVVHLL